MGETISLKEIFETIKKRLLLIILLTIGAAIVSAGVTYFVMTPTYQSSSQFIVNQKESAQMGVDVNEIRSNIEIINTYNVIIKSPAILQDVADELNLSLTADQLAEMIQVSSEQNSQVVTVTATDESPKQAVDIANTTVSVFKEKIPTLMNVDNVNILSEAFVPDDPSPVNPKPLLNMAVAVVLGIVVGVGLAFLLEYLDNTIKTEIDVEQRLDIPVLGVIPHIREDDLINTAFTQQVARRGRGEFDGQKKKTV
ncbi:Wzz/FepE/Etk N-terminal domain-containing protein [Radiobacillus kanasensis]|uniref:YveK family protein n=1 Tax=Radiobacillus kanasensis TaxID=2844358 RepID=UPI001E52347F|nr:Wzz/FepE/Etk N-terminal domain-containing protein [Radiobacillus kanasensis]UFT98859.1 Wzz/FepE/Etk N-terminal domain-containing protein [Radiobacillus kanasensis]